MWSTLLSFIALALSFPVFSLALPNSISSREPTLSGSSKDLPRTLGNQPPASFPDRCGNAPDITAGTLPTPQPQPHSRRFFYSPLQPRASIHTGSWYTSGKCIYVRVFVTRTILGPLIPTLLTEAYGVVHDTIAHMNDGIIKPGGFRWTNMMSQKTLRVWNTNEEELMWGTLEAALQATYGVMSAHEWGAAVVTIFEEGKEVARAWIG